MKDQVKVPVIVAAVIVLVALAVFFGSKAMGSGDLDTGEHPYTPGKPPWEDPLKKGAPPAGSPGAGQPVPSQPGGAPPPPPGGGPPGMSAPTLSGGKG